MNKRITKKKKKTSKEQQLIISVPDEMVSLLLTKVLLTNRSINDLINEAIKDMLVKVETGSKIIAVRKAKKQTLAGPE